MADYKYSTPKKLMEAICDAIRRKNGTNDIIPHQDIPEQIDVIADATSILDRSVTEYTDTKITSLGVACFRGCTSLTKVDMPNVILIKGQAFYGCTSLVDVNLPNITSGDSNIGNDFFGCTSLESISLPDLTHVVTNMFTNCTKLKEVNFPSVTRTSTYAFNNCKALNKLILPELTVSEGAMLYNSGIKLVEFPKMSAFTGNNHFFGCTNLTTVILSGDKVATIQYTTTFKRTPIESGTGYIYVPSTLVNSYKTATNWSTFANQIRAIEDWENRIDINTQPVDITAAPTETVTFSVVADGMGLSYQWYLCKDGVNWEVPTSLTSMTSNYTISNVRTNYSGWKVKCVITNIKGYSVETDVVALTVE